VSRIDVINKSLRCFVLGLIGLVPVLGIPAGVLAITTFRRVTLHNGEGWNPARPYLIWGFCLGAGGLLLSFIVTMMFAINLINATPD
jgi:hypothetical protein